MLSKCNAIHVPTTRDKFVNHFGLKDADRITPKFFGGGLRNGYTYESEVWRLDSGNIIEAVDAIYVGAVPITEYSIDSLLNSPNRTSTGEEPLFIRSLPGNLFQQARQLRKIKEVDSFTILTEKRDVMYSSLSHRHKHNKTSISTPDP